MEPEEPEQPQLSQKPSKGYGKRPVWHWVLLYVVVAIILYGLIYILFIRKTGSAGAY